MAPSYSEIWDNFFAMYKRKIISIYHKPGPFVYEVRDMDGSCLYVGGTQNINAKSFKFPFPFADIKGYYYPEGFPDFEDEVDRRIAKLEPRYNTVLRASYTLPMVLKHIRSLFYKSNIRFPKSAEGLVAATFNEYSPFEFKGQKYIGKFDLEDLTINVTSQLGYEIEWKPLS